MKKRFQKWFLILAGSFLSGLFLFQTTVFASIGQEPIKLPSLDDLVCAAYLSYDTENEEILVSSKETEKIYPASMTKVLTAALALEHLPMDKIISVSQSALNGTTPDSSLMGLVLGEQVLVSELIYGLMLPSGNDAANVLAEAVVEETGFADPSAPDKTKLSLFSDIMNQKIASLGLAGTHFLNAHGLHDENHYTTALDLVKIFQYAMTYDGFIEVISSNSHAFKATNMHTYDAWLVSRNTNFLLEDPWILGNQTNVARIIGGKTGTTSAAGSCLVQLAQVKNGHYIINVIAGVPSGGSSRMTTFMATLINAGANVCWTADSTIRVDGSVMTNKKDNKPVGWTEPTVPEEEVLPTSEEEGEPSSPLAHEQETKTTEITQVPQDGFSISDFFSQNGRLILACVILLIALIACVVILRQIMQNQKRR